MRAVPFSPLESIGVGDTVLALIIRADFNAPGIHFFTEGG